MRPYQDKIKKDTMNKQVLKLAIPNIVSNIAVPLAGMIDLALMGYLNGAVDYVAAISLVDDFQFRLCDLYFSSHDHDWIHCTGIWAQGL